MVWWPFASSRWISRSVKAPRRPRPRSRRRVSCGTSRTCSRMPNCSFPGERRDARCHRLGQTPGIHLPRRPPGYSDPPRCGKRRHAESAHRQYTDAAPTPGVSHPGLNPTTAISPTPPGCPIPRPEPSRPPSPRPRRGGVLKGRSRAGRPVRRRLRAPRPRQDSGARCSCRDTGRNARRRAELLITVNGQPRLVAQQDGVTVTVFAFDIARERIKQSGSCATPRSSAAGRRADARLHSIRSAQSRQSRQGPGQRKSEPTRSTNPAQADRQSSRSGGLQVAWRSARPGARPRRGSRVDENEAGAAVGGVGTVAGWFPPLALVKSQRRRRLVAGDQPRAGLRCGKKGGEQLPAQSCPAVRGCRRSRSTSDQQWGNRRAERFHLGWTTRLACRSGESRQGVPVGEARELAARGPAGHGLEIGPPRRGRVQPGVPGGRDPRLAQRAAVGRRVVQRLHLRRAGHLPRAAAGHLDLLVSHGRLDRRARRPRRAPRTASGRAPRSRAGR